LTVFSAPNYAESYENFSAFMRFNDDKYEFEQCSWTAQPFYLPQFANVFNYSMPFVFEAFSKFCLSFLQLCEAQEDEADLEVDEKTLKAARELAASRLKSVSRTHIFMRTQRAEAESLLSQGLRLRESAKDVFAAARKADARNERKPPTWQTFRSVLQAGAVFGRLLDARRSSGSARTPSPSAPQSSSSVPAAATAAASSSSSETPSSVQPRKPHN